MSGTDRSDYGYPAPGKPKKMMDEGDDTTRKVSAGGISFAPMSGSPFAASQFSSVLSSNELQGAQPQKARAQGVARKELQESFSKVFRWRLGTVPVLPEFHPLERTAVFVDGDSPSEISERISTVLRKRSIEAAYDDEKAKVRCLTASGVDFRIRLYRGRGNFSHGIIVEVQRRFGHSIDFHNDTNAILDAAKDSPSATPHPPPLSPASGSNLPMVSDSEDDEEDYGPHSGASSLLMITKMLAHIDTHYLALQMLTSLTDASKMGSVTAKNVSTELLKVDNEVGSTLVDLIVSEKQEDGFNIHFMALTAMANVLSEIKGEISDMLREKIRPALLKELHEAGASNLLAAQQAARCLEYMWQGDHNVGELQAALEYAKGVGEVRHSGLERQTVAVLSKIAG